ncbi:tripartite tricarboxylate transporter TctB family protein [Phaeovulum sp. W22_SRMD_FR3]|uniref:tripartite tricarboxylate transporter TctB family protein n=1 Tax=Phaeovulum sp. W22_SRMD_FR3 TaxID=3240274 RepID=UPI003F97A2A3
MQQVGQKRSDIVIGAALLVFCGFAAWRSLKIPSRGGSSLAGPAFLPWIMIAAVAVLSVWMILRAWKRNSDLQIEMPDGATLRRMGLLALVFVAYAAAFMPVGYLISTVAVFIAALWLFGERNRKVLVLFPIAMTGAVYLGFTQALKVWLP